MNSSKSNIPTIRKFIGIIVSLFALILLIFLSLISALFGRFSRNVYLDDILRFGIFVVLATGLNYFIFKTTWGKEKAKKFTISFAIVGIILWIILAIGEYKYRNYF